MRYLSLFLPFLFLFADDYETAERYYKQKIYTHAIMYYERSTNPAALKKLASIYEHGINNRYKDTRKAIEVYKKLRDKESYFFLYRLLIKSNRFDEAVETLQKAAKQRLPFANYILGEYYYYGKYVTKDLKKAEKFLRASDTAEAYLLLGKLYLSENKYKDAKIVLVRSFSLNGSKEAYSLYNRHELWLVDADTDLPSGSRNYQESTHPIPKNKFVE